MFYLFDIDGTLIDWKTGEFLPGVLDWFGDKRGAEVALVTNQGGPACRDAGWGTKYPTLEDTLAKYSAIADKLNAMLYISLAFQSNGGGWWYPNDIQENDERIKRSWRKPSNGMLVQAMKDFRATTAVMVGDRDEDRLAAESTPGCSFIWAKDFFVPQPRQDNAWGDGHPVFGGR
jgi:histidinol phosphatase-like enzyme